MSPFTCTRPHWIGRPARHTAADAPQTMYSRASLRNLKYRIFGHPRFLLRGLAGAKIEIGLGVMAYNLKRIMSVLGGAKLAVLLQT